MRKIRKQPKRVVRRRKRKSLEDTLMESGIRVPPKKNRDEYHDLAGFFRVYFRRLRSYIVSGLLVWVPLLVTMWVTWWFVTNVAFELNDFIRGRVEILNAWGAKYPALSFLAELHYETWIGFLLAILIFLTTGFLARYFVGRKLIGLLDRAITNIPIISKVYVAVQQIRDVFVGRDGAVFEEVVLVEYPRRGIQAVGFLTSREQGIVQETAEEKLIAVFVPTTPNPTSGFLLYFPPEEVIPMGITVEDAMKLIISGGAFIPNQGRPKDDDDDLD